MALRYAAILPGPGMDHLPPACPAPPGFHLLVDHAQMRVLTDYPAGPDCTAFRDGAVLGRLFGRDRFAPVTEIEPTEGAAIASGRGQRLMERYWGGYVAFLIEPKGGAAYILRDPSGALPCYYSEVGGLLIFASDMETLMTFGMAAPGIDWAYVLRHLASGGLEVPRTGLIGVEELLRGTRATIARGSMRVAPCWSPWDHVDADIPFAGAAAAAHLREVVQRSVAAWGGCFEKILLSVSGGLDSSIVAACLYARKNTQCLTMVTQDPDGDERNHARIVAGSLGWPLHEEFYDFDLIDLSRSSAAHLPRPCGRPFAQQWDAANQRIAAEIGADAHFNGNGGDNIFCLAHNVAPAVDRWLTSGFSRDFWNTARDLSRITGASLLEICKAVRRRLQRKQNRVRWHWDMAYLVPDAVPEPSEYPDHPWLNPPPEILPGKAAHVMGLLRVHGALDGYERSLGQVVAPLLAQPIVETCLAIPTWRWCEGGLDRSIAREAFSGHLPASILTRRSKGGPESFSVALFETNRKLIRERLLDGRLIDQGMLDAAALGTRLTGEAPLASEEYLRFLALNDVEAWASHWTAIRNSSVAASQPNI